MIFSFKNCFDLLWQKVVLSKVRSSTVIWIESQARNFNHFSHTYLVEMSSRWNFPARASPSCESSKQTRIVRTLQWNHFLNVEYIMSDIRKPFSSVDLSFFKFPVKNHSLNCCSEISEVTWKLFCQKFLIERLFCSKRSKLLMYSLVLSGSFLHSSPRQLTWMCYVAH